MISSPLEQFALIPLIPMRLGNFDFSITHSTLMMYLGIIAFFSLLSMISIERGGTIVPNRWQYFVESIYDTCMTLANDSITGGKGQKYFPIVFVLFTFILVCNVTGMVPYSFTATSHISFTLGLAMITFMGYHIIGVRKHGIRLLELYLPPGVDLALALLIVPIEFLAQFSRIISLSVRLFANMMAGHTMMKVFGGFVVSLGILGGWLPLSFSVALTGLEILVAFLQAYVFAILTCIYLNDALNLHH